ncbi:MAG: hypothetical protein ACI9W2_004952 [Gammaproteobacteria bacterium]|jgi:hypothetical protein
MTLATRDQALEILGAWSRVGEPLHGRVNVLAVFRLH